MKDEHYYNLYECDCENDIEFTQKCSSLDGVIYIQTGKVLPTITQIKRSRINAIPILPIPNTL